MTETTETTETTENTDAGVEIEAHLFEEGNEAGVAPGHYFTFLIGGEPVMVKDDNVMLFGPHPTQEIAFAEGQKLFAEFRIRAMLGISIEPATEEEAA